MLSSTELKAVQGEIQELTHEDSREHHPTMDSNEEILYLLFEHLKSQ